MAEPTLYEYNGKKYNYDTLRQQAFKRLAEEFSAEKDYDQYRQALTNLVEGIRTNRVSYKDGSFYDSQGEYKNGLYIDKKGKSQFSKRYKRDYYGRVANILQDLYNSASEYISPEESNKIKWGDNALSKALNKELFGNGDPKYFKDLDYDEKTQKYGTANRTNAFSTALDNLYNNFDKTFTGFDESQKRSALTSLGKAKALFNDGKLSRNEWLELSKIFKGLNPEELFSTATEIPEVKQEVLDWNGFNLDENTLAILGKLPRETQQTIYDTLLKSAQDNINQQLQLASPKQEAPSQQASYNLNAWDQFLNSNPDVADFTRGAGSVSQKFTYDSNKRLPQISNLGELISKEPNRAAKYLAQIIIDSTYQYTPNEQEQQKAAQNAFNKYLIKQHDAKGHVVYQVKNSKDNKGEYLYVVPVKGQWFLKRAKQYADIKQELAQTPQAKHGGVLDFYMAQRFKNGGILKAQTGAKTPWEAITYDANDLLTRFKHIVNNGVLGFALRNNPATNIKNDKTNQYDPEEGSGNLMKSREGTDAWTNWLNLLRNNSKLAETWANKYKELSPETSKEFWQPWYDDNGTFNFQKFQNALNAAINNKNGMWLDSINGIGHDFYKGRTYQIEGQDGYYDKPLEGYKVKNIATDNSGLFDIYTLVKDEQPAEKLKETPEEVSKDKGDGSWVNPRGEKAPKSSFWKNLWGNLEGYGPESLELKRYFDSVIANNSIADPLKKAAKPVLKNTWQGYSPVTGDWAARQAYNNQAAETRRLGARFFTSDPSLMLAQMFDANRQAQEAEQKGLLADNQRWKETKDQAFKLNLDNMARLSDTANYNRLAIHDANQKLAEIEATRQKSNWLSGDQYWQGVGSRWQNRLDEQKALAQQTSTYLMSQDYDEAVRLLDKKYKQAHPNATSVDMMADYNYLDALNRIKRIRQGYVNDILKNRKYTPVYGTSVTGNYNNVLNRTSFAKAGGILKRLRK